MLAKSKLHFTKGRLGGESGRYLQAFLQLYHAPVVFYASFKKPGQGWCCGKTIMAGKHDLRDQTNDK
jgi:hypothetical protein